MKHSRVHLLVLGILGSLFFACTRDKDKNFSWNLFSDDITVEEARYYFENESSQTRTELSNILPFALNDAILNWDEAGESSSDIISSVDVPISGEQQYVVVRFADGFYPYSVMADSKVVIVKSQETGEMQTYVRISIPDEAYDGGGKVCDLTLNCEHRGHYSGLEFYVTPNGFPAAVVQYREGEPVSQVFLYDTEKTATQKREIFARLMGDTFIIPIDNSETRAFVSDGEWDYGLPGSAFIGTDGEYYVYVDTDGDGKSDSITTLEFYNNMMGNWAGDGISPPDWGGDDSGGGGSGGGSEGGGIPEGGSEGVSGGGGSGNGADSGDSSGEGTGDGAGDGTGDGTGDSSSGEGTENPDIPTTNPDAPDITPIPWQDNITPPSAGGGGSGDDDNEESEEEEEEEQPAAPKVKPCADSLAMEANPLMEMQISDDNKSWRSNTWGFTRIDPETGGSKFHDGLDLLGEEGVTPVYSMYDGVVVKVVWGQPYRIDENTYPADYSGDKDGAGNRVTIMTRLPNGKIIYVSYWHLAEYGKNPYTHKLKYGQKVKAGEIIGIVGRTGNAYKKKAHLHLKTKIDGTDTKNDPINNPTHYLYTKFNEHGIIIRDC